MSKDMRIFGYFSKPKGVRDQKKVWETLLCSNGGTTRLALTTLILRRFACTQHCSRRAFYMIFEERRPIINETKEVFMNGRKEESNK